MGCSFLPRHQLLSFFSGLTGFTESSSAYVQMAGWGFRKEQKPMKFPEVGIWGCSSAVGTVGPSADKDDEVWSS